MSMEKREIIILVAALTFAGIRLYMKYANKKNADGNQKQSNDLTASGKDDDYEPYSGK